MKKIYEIESLEDFKENYPNMFKDHIATIKYSNGNDCIIDFKVPETNICAMKFIYIDGVLNINGDYGYAVFNWYNKKNHILSYLNFKDIGYIMEKCVSSLDSDINGFDVDLFHSDFESFIEDRKEDGSISPNDQYHVPYCETHSDVINYFKETDEYGDDLYETGAFNLGTYLKERPYIWWYGLHTAIKQLESQF